MQPTPRIDVLNRDLWQQVRARLEAMTAHDPAMVPAFRQVITPVLALEALGADCLGALMNRPASVERLRAALTLLSADLVARRDAVTDVPDAAARDAAARDAPADSPSLGPGLISAGAMLILYGAAIRVAPGRGAASRFVELIRRLLVECGPAEMLGRIDAFGSDERVAGTLIAAVAALLQRDDPRLGPVLAADPVEAGRLMQVEALRRNALDVLGAQPSSWDGALAATSVDPARATAGERIAVTPPEMSEAAGIVVVFASPFVVLHLSPTTGATGSRRRGSRATSTLRVSVPDDAKSGWVGVASEAVVASSNALRERFADLYAELHATAPMEPDELRRLLTIALGDPATSWPLPPRTTRDLLELAPHAATITAVACEGPGGAATLVSGLAGDVVVTIAGLSARPLMRVRLRVDGRLTGARDAAARTAFPLAGALVHPGVLLRAELAVHDEAPAHHAFDLAPRVVDPRPNVEPSIRLVLVRPRVIDATPQAAHGGGALPPRRTSRVTPEEAARALRRVDRAGVAFIGIDELPWSAEEALEVVDGPLTSKDDPRCNEILEALAWTAAQTPGHEDALWVAVLPDLTPDVEGEPVGGDDVRRTVPVGLHVIRNAGAARAVALSTVSDLPALIGEAAGRGAFAIVERPCARLRLMGELRGDDVRLMTPREEPRAVGRGDPGQTSVTLCQVDAEGQLLSRRALQTLRPSPARFAVLLAVSEKTAAVEFRKKDKVLHRVTRPRLGPDQELPVPVLPEDALPPTYRWSVGLHPLGLTLVGALEGVVRRRSDSQRELRVPLGMGTPCCTCVEVPASAIQHLEGVEVVVSDGWNMVRSRGRVVPRASGASTRIVALGGGRYWVDGGAAANVFLDGRPVASLAAMSDGSGAGGHMLRLRDGLVGKLLVTGPDATAPDAEPRPMAVPTILPPGARPPMRARRVGGVDG